MSLVLRWPLELDAAGKLALATSDAEVWDLRLKALMSTRTGERAMRTTYGCYLPERLFASFSPTNPEDDIRMAVSQWLPALTVTKVAIHEIPRPAPHGMQDRTYNVVIEYLTPSNRATSTSLSYTYGGSE